jgi:hypothetical protein
MSSTPPEDPRGATSELVMLAAGTVIVLATIGGWLYGATHGIDTAPLFAFTIPVVTALFVAKQLGKAGDAAQQAATQTNGLLGPRIKAAVSEALADRDAARTRQQRGDVSEDAAAPRPPAGG